MLSVSCYTKNILGMFTICSKNALIFFFTFCLFVSKVCFCFLSQNLRFRYTQNILYTFTNCSKIFVKMLGLIFFQILGCFQSLFFVTHPAAFCFCYTHTSSVERFSENFDQEAVTYLIFFVGTPLFQKCNF